VIGDLLDQVLAHDHIEAVLLFARLPWPLRRILGRVRLLLGRLRRSRAQRAWVREMEDEDARR